MRADFSSADGPIEARAQLLETPGGGKFVWFRLCQGDSSFNVHLPERMHDAAKIIVDLFNDGQRGPVPEIPPFTVIDGGEAVTHDEVAAGHVEGTKPEVAGDHS